jgi:glycerol-3-phosphate acyltransferase PlsY
MESLSFWGIILAALSIAVVSYLCGSVPVGYLIGRMHGVDIRTQGSGNIGATNVTRVIGSRWGKLCFFLDFFKGLAPVVLVSILTPGAVLAFLPDSWFAGAVILPDPWGIFPSVAAFAAVAGHIWPCWLGFRGGKGVSTAAGAVFALNPPALLSAGAVWAVVFFASRYVSLASLLAAASMPLWAILFRAAGLTRSTVPEIVLFALLALLTIVKHTSNIRRLIQGTESRFVKKTDPEKDGK